MERNEIYEILQEIFASLFGDDVPTLTDETTARDVDGWDSLMHITLISEVENRFDMKFTMKDVIGMQNVGEMVDLIEENV